MSCCCAFTQISGSANSGVFSQSSTSRSLIVKTAFVQIFEDSFLSNKRRSHGVSWALPSSERHSVNVVSSGYTSQSSSTPLCANSASGVCGLQALKLLRESFLVSLRDAACKEKTKMGSCELGGVCREHGWDFQSGICKREDCLKNRSHDYLVLFSCRNWVQSPRLPRVIVHRADTEIPFSYKMRVHYLLPKTRVLGMEATKKLVNVLFMLNLKQQ